MKELTSIIIYADGRIEPPTPFGTAVLLIQDETVQVGRISPDDDYVVSIEHPKNQAELDIRATEIIKNTRPEYLSNEKSLVVICPLDIANDMIW